MSEVAPPFPPDSLALAFWYASASFAHVMEGHSLADGSLKTIPLATRREAQDMVYGTLRRYLEGEALLTPLLRNRPRLRIMALLLLAVYRLESRPEISYTVINQAVKAAEFMEGGSYKGLTNGVLRNFTRRREELFAALPEAARLCHPDWWVARLKTTYPTVWQKIIEAGNMPPPMTLRVNLRQTTREAALLALQEAGIEAVVRGECGLLLKQPMPVERIPGFMKGDVSVQDLGAQRAAQILAPAKGSRVLDACAAPGGKTGHLLEQGKEITLVAEDISYTRCQRIRKNLARLNFFAHIRVNDVTRPPPEEYREERFDAILTDVPCSASGVARRFPDIKWLRRDADVANFARIQANILKNLWARLQAGGKLLYATCSVFPQENEDQVRRFLERCQDASLQHEEKLLPNEEQDGFYYALLQKHP